MRIAFFGTGEFSKNILEGVLKIENVEVCVVVSQPDKQVGRKKILEKTQVKLFAEENDLSILQPNNLKDNIEFSEKLKSLDLDFAVVVAYGKILPKVLLDIPKYSFINIHGSILPCYRGASPIQEAIKFGDIETGLTIMQISEGMDEGNIFEIEKVKIGFDDKTEDIFKKFEDIGPDLLINSLEKIISGELKSINQGNKGVTYCSKISKDDGKVNFSFEKSDEIYNKYRAYYNWPGIYSFYNGKKINFEECEIFNDSNKLENINIETIIKGKVIKIDKKTIGIVCSDKKILILKKIKLEGKKSMDILSFINGNKDFLDYKF